MSRRIDSLIGGKDGPPEFTLGKSKLHPFLEGKVYLETLTIGGRTGGELLSAMDQKGIQVGPHARSMIDNPAFTTSLVPRKLTLVDVATSTLVAGKGRYLTIQEIFDAADRLGLDKVPAEVGPHYRLSHMKRREENIVIGMDPIVASDGGPGVFGVVQDKRG